MLDHKNEVYGCFTTKSEEIQVYGSIEVEEDWANYIVRSLIYILHVMWI
jgi:hypothetical protein